MDQADAITLLSPRPGLRLGIMGGAFDPIHVAHLVTAQEALLQFSLDEVVFLPSGRPPIVTTTPPGLTASNERSSVSPATVWRPT